METTTSSNVYLIDPLKGTKNYAVWKIKIMDILTKQGAYGMVTGKETCPEDFELNKMWEKKDRTALSMIQLCVANKMLVYVASATSSKVAWETLKEMLEPQGTLGKVLIQQKLFQAQCKEGMSIEEHIWTLHEYQ
jgi:hypothetical protein